MTRFFNSNGEQLFSCAGFPPFPMGHLFRYVSSDDSFVEYSVVKTVMVVEEWTRVATQRVTVRAHD